MLSVEQVRKLIGEECPESDEDVISIRDELYRVVRLAIRERGHKHKEEASP